MSTWERSIYIYITSNNGNVPDHKLSTFNALIRNYIRVVNDLYFSYSNLKWNRVIWLHVLVHDIFQVTNKMIYAYIETLRSFI